MRGSNATSRRVLMYSHDTFGLGHLTRTLRIAEAIQERHTNVSILVLSGLPVAPYLPLPPRTDLVKLPSVLKSGAEQYESRDLDVGFKQIRSMRRGVIRSTAETFRPHVFLVDNVPLGMKGEILPTLEFLRGRAKCVLNLRDILDEPEAIRTRWLKDGVHAALERYYDAVHVFGDERVFDAVAAYGLPADRTKVLGYVTPGARVSQDDLPSINGVPRRRKVLVTAGGGGDALAFFQATLEGLELVRRKGEYDVDVELVTGPLMEDEARKDLLARADVVGAMVLEFVPDLPARMQRADLVVAMAGYNTCSEILTCSAAALLHPRTHPRLEQKIRSDAFAALGLARSLPGGEPSPKGIAEEVESIFRDHHRLDEDALPQLGGQQRAARALDRWLLPPTTEEVTPTGAVGEHDPGAGASSTEGFYATSPSRNRSQVLDLRLRFGSGRPHVVTTWVPPWPGVVAV